MRKYKRPHEAIEHCC